jgi:hypothetical protein
LRIQGTGFRVQGTGSRVQGSGFRVRENRPRRRVGSQRRPVVWYRRLGGDPGAGDDQQALGTRDEIRQGADLFMADRRCGVGFRA